MDTLNVSGIDYTAIRDLLMYDIAQLPLVASDILYAITDDVISNLPVGAEGQMLKVTNGLPYWGEDIDTDIDTVGITVQENGVTVAENVVNINIIHPTQTVVTTPTTAQVDIDIQQLLGAVVFEDTDQLDTNLNPEPTIGTGVTTLDLFTTLGIIAGTGEYYFMAEGSNAFLDSVSGVGTGTWGLKVAFRDNAGAAISDVIVSGSTDGGNLLNNNLAVPNLTRYIDTYWWLIPLYPLFLTKADFSDRYRLLYTASGYGVQASPTGKTVSGVYTSTTP